MNQYRDWVSLGIAADQLKKPVSYLIGLCEQGDLSGYVFERWGGKTGYRLLQPQEVAQHYARLVFERAELAPLLEESRRVRETEDLRQQLEKERTARQAAELRAEQAEAETEGLRQQLCDAEAAYEALRRQERTTQESPPAVTATGLTFPYATKELEAMRAAVAKYWEGYTPDKRQPTQKEISLWIGESLGLQRQASGDAARAAIVMAGAIKRPADT